MIVIEIDSIATKEKSGANEKGPWRMVFQQINITGHYVDGFSARHPRETTIQLDEKNPQPYPVGLYVISPEAFYFGDFGRFAMGRLRLLPMKDYIANLQKQLGAVVTFPQPKAA